MGMYFSYPGTIPTDICSSTCYTRLRITRTQSYPTTVSLKHVSVLDKYHITRTHITGDMCSPTWKTHSTSDMCFPTVLGNTYF